MRAVTGTILSSQPCPTAKVPRVFERFLEEVGSDILSSDAATYLRTSIEAADELNFFRRDLRRRQLREGGGDSERRHRNAPVDEEDRWEPKVEEEDGRRELKVEDEEEDGISIPVTGETKSSKSKVLIEDLHSPFEEKRDIAAPHGDLHSPASEKQRKKKEKSVKEEDETWVVIEEQSRKALDVSLQHMVSAEGTGSEKKAKKKKHIKQEEEVRDAKEVEQKMVHAGVAENRLASKEKKRKKRKHAEEQEAKKQVIVDGNLGSDEKRKKEERQSWRYW